MATLSISGPMINNCDDIVEILCKLGIEADVTQNKTIICKNNHCKIENGCRILLGDGWNSKVWNHLQKQYDLDCAHVSIPSKFNGCVTDWISGGSCR